jgi:DNA-directed RNA polymerase specialized sigma24 family protein
MCARPPEGGIEVKTISAAQAVEALLRAYGKLVFHTIYGLTSDWEESQDLTQETFLQAPSSRQNEMFLRLWQNSSCAPR